MDDTSKHAHVKMHNGNIFSLSRYSQKVISPDIVFRVIIPSLGFGQVEIQVEQMRKFEHN